MKTTGTTALMLALHARVEELEATRAAIKQLQADFNSHAESAAGEIRRLHARNQELEAMLDAVGAGDVSAQRITQADARDATQILIRPAAAQKIPRDPIPTVDTWETCTIKEAKELNPALWRVRMLYPQEVIDAAIATAKEMK